VRSVTWASAAELTAIATGRLELVQRMTPKARRYASGYVRKRFLQFSMRAMMGALMFVSLHETISHIACCCLQLSMTGMTDTVLSLGRNDTDVHKLAAKAGDRAA
jgi:hypothetical protein